MLPFRPRLNHLNTDRLERRLGRTLRQRLREGRLHAGTATGVATEAAPPARAVDPGSMLMIPEPDMRPLVEAQPLLVSMQHIRWLLLHLRHLIVRQRVGMILGAGDNMFVWNRREPSIATGQMGEGDNVTEMDLEVAARTPLP